MSDQSSADGYVAGHVDGPPAPQDKPASRWEDFIDIFYAPSQVFARRANSGFGVPLLVVTLLTGIIFWANSAAMQPIMDAEFSRQTAAMMKANPNITPEMMEKGRAFGETMTKIGAFIFMPIAIFIIGLLLWVVGKFFDAKQTLGAAIMVAAYAYLPRVAEAVVNGVQALLMDPASMTGRLKLSLGVGRFLDPDTASPMLLAVVGRLDVFTIWVTVLLVIGLSVTGKIPRAKAAIAGVIMWCLGALPPLLGAARM
jgi:hypothetical protein